MTQTIALTEAGNTSDAVTRSEPVLEPNPAIEPNPANTPDAVHARRSQLSPSKLAVLKKLTRGRAGAQRSQIPRRTSSGPAVLSFSQERLWFLEQLLAGSGVYNLAQAFVLSGPLSHGTLEHALGELMNRHEVLRSAFNAPAGTPQQVVTTQCQLPLHQVDLRNLQAVEETAEAISHTLLGHPFDLQQSPLFRAVVFTLGDQENVLLLMLHHLVADGWSFSVLTQELEVLYQAAKENRPAPLPPLPIQYADFAEWQRERLTGDFLDERLSFWLQRLTPPPPVLELPTDRPRPPVQSFEGARRRLRLSTTVAQQLTALGQQHQASLFMVVLAAFKALLFRMTHQKDLVVGTPVAGRKPKETEGLVGMFVNTLALRTVLEEDLTYISLLERVRKGTLEAYDHQEIPFEKLVQKVQPERDLSVPPLFQVMLAFHNNAARPLAFDDVKVQPWPLEIHTAQFDFTLDLHPSPEGIEGALDYSTALFDATTMQRFVGYLEHLFNALLAKPESPLTHLPLLGDAESQQLVVEWNDRETARRPEVGLHELIELQVERTPERLALVTEEGHLTYRGLNAQANRLAHLLRHRGIGPEMRVGLAIDRGLHMSVGLLAILKAGGAYVPFDPSYPRERLAFLLEDSRVEVLLSDERLGHQLSGLFSSWGGEVLYLDALQEQLAQQSEENPHSLIDPDHPAYVIYTSGSTGRPKGAVNSHRAIVNRLLWMQEAFTINADDRILQKTPFSFDVSVWELFWPFMVGARLVMARPAGHQDAGYLAQVIHQQRVTTLHFVPSMLQVFLDHPAVDSCQGLKRVITSGEALPHDLEQRFFARLDTELHNLYGPTEAAIDVTWWVCRRDHGLTSVPIGMPIANTAIRVLDQHLRQVPCGISGELHIAGEGLARGYFDRPALTASRFLPDPFELDTPGRRLYKTGDRVRYLASGDIEFLGRLDHQVKIRGFRIELGEIEAVLALHPAVRQAVVLASKRSNGDLQLVAFVVLDQETEDQVKLLRSYLREDLPEHMIPSVLLPLPALPVTPNGKLDRQALERKARESASRAPRSEGLVPQAAPQTHLERTLAEIWQEVLDLDRVGVTESFFELGGHSLLLARVQSLIHRHLEREVSMIDLFRHPTVSSLARFLRRDQNVSSNASLNGTTVEQARPKTEGVVKSNDIAILGMAGRFPGAPSVDALWNNLRDGVESITFFSSEELDAVGVPTELQNDPLFVAARGVLTGVENFDAAFFDFAPREAEILDPQQRFFLECAVEALENAAQNPGGKRVGVFAGAGMNSYLLNNLRSNPELMHTVGSFQAMLASDKDYLASRVSYKLNLKGPSITVQSACSTSLVALCLASQSLLDGHCDMALAGGVSIDCPQAGGTLYQEGGILSSDGHCRAFDAQAQGMVTGNGAAVVVLKRLADALADGDPIRAVIKGTATNNDGALKVGYTAPSVEGQAEVIAAAQAMAGIDPRTITYVEAHGTGTALGDPIEVAALKEVFGQESDAPWCALGSVKTNIGHLDTASGIAGLVKTVLALEHGELPPSLHFEEPNPRLGLEGSPFFVNAQRTPWHSEGPRRAGVSSFGIGGTNAHVVLEEAPSLSTSETSRPWQLLTLSARTKKTLEARSGELLGHLEAQPEISPADLAATLHLGRWHFEHRRTLLYRDVEDLTQGLIAADPRELTTTVAEDAAPPVTFLFPGQGAQHVQMGLDLYRTEPFFAAWIDRCAEILQPHLGLDLRTLLFPTDEGVSAADKRLRQTEFTQPALFVVEYALARLWQNWGVQPEAMIGHSIGEYVAACLAGVFSLEDALVLVAFRGRLMAVLPPGAMLSVGLSEEALLPWVTEDLEVAAWNAHDLAVISGPESAVDSLAERLHAAGVKHQRLHTSHAFHSAMMEPILEPFRNHLRGLELASPQIPFLSNLTGTWIRREEATSPQYWAEHLRHTVRFADGLGEILREPSRVLLEVGPGRVLSTLARRQGAARQRVISSLPPANGPQASDRTVLGALGRLWSLGVEVDWIQYHVEERRQRLQLPTYPFDRRTFWVEPGAAGVVPHSPAPREWFYTPSWTRTATPQKRQQAQEQVTPTSWLLFDDHLGVGAALAAKLRHLGDEVIRVAQGESVVGEHLKCLDPTHTSGEHGTPRVQRLVFLRGLHRIAPQASEQTDLLSLAQALAAQPLTQVDLTVVTADAQEVLGDEMLANAAVDLLALCRHLPKALPGLTCRALDVRRPSTPMAIEDLANQILLELLGQPSEDMVAWRSIHRWAQGFTKVFLPTERPRAMEPSKGLVALVGDSTAVPPSLRDAFLRSGLTFVPLDINLEMNLEDTSLQTKLRTELRRLEAEEEEFEGVLYAPPLPTSWPAEIVAVETAAWVDFLATCQRQAEAVHRAVVEVNPKFCFLLGSPATFTEGPAHLPALALDTVLSATLLRREREDTPWTAISWLLDFANSGVTAEQADEALARLLELSGMSRLVVSPQSPESLTTTAALDAEEEASGSDLYQRPDLDADFVAPRNAMEEQIAAIWRYHLGIKEIGVYDDFFELGGHSLLVVQVLAEMRQSLGRDVSASTLFENPNLAGMASALAQDHDPSADAGPVVPISQGEPLSLSYIQKEVWDWERTGPPKAPLPNIAFAWRVPGDTPSVPFLESAFAEIAQRHAILRSNFEDAPEAPRWIVHERLDPEIPVIDLRALTPAAGDEAARRWAKVEGLRGFDLGTDPLLRVRLLRCREDSILLLTLHRMVADGGSVNLLVRELCALYDAFRSGRPSPLAPLTLQYADFAAWQHRALSADALERLWGHWRPVVEDLPRLTLHADHPRPAHQTFRGSREFLEFTKDEAYALLDLSRQEGVTLFMVFLGMFSTLLSRDSGQEEVGIVTVVDHREEETSDLIGRFVNNLLVRIDLAGDPTLRQLLGRVRTAALGSYAHQEMPFNLLVDTCWPEEKHRDSLGQVRAMLIIQKVARPNSEDGGLQLNPWAVDRGSVDCDLSLRIIEGPHGLNGYLEYSTDLFEPAHIRRLARSFETFLTRSVESPGNRLSRLLPTHSIQDSGE